MDARVEELSVRLETVEAQRNRALADHAVAEGRLHMARRDVDSLKQRVAELEARLMEMEGGA